MPSASTLMKNQAQCYASFRTPLQVGAAGWGWGQGSSWEGLETPRVGTWTRSLLCPQCSHLYKWDYMLARAV